MKYLLFIILLTSLFSCTNPTMTFEITFKPTVDTDSVIDVDYVKGVSAQYGGIIGNRLVMAGGSNFPDVPAAKGGKKRYYDEIYIATLPVDNNDTLLHWKLAGRLPQPAAYGISVYDSENNSLVFIGGMNSDRSLNHVYQLSLENEEVLIDTLPSLPVTIDNMYGAILNRTIYVVGGNVNGEASSTVFSLDLNHTDNGWTLETTIPGSPRIQPICAACGKNLYVWSGMKIAGAESTIETTGYKFDIHDKKWEKISSPTNEEKQHLTLTGGIATTTSDGNILCAGGVNYNIFLKALKGEFPKEFPYMLQSIEWYHFNDRLLLYHPLTDTWENLGHYPQTARAGATFAVCNPNYYYILGGELKPGIRSSENNRLFIQ